MTTTTDYIQQLVLADDGPTRHRMTVTRGLGAGEVEAPVLPASPLPAGLQAAVDAGTLLSFVDGIGRQERDDVLHAVQLAHRGASGRFDRGTQVAEWYRLYTEILEQVGWTAERLAFAEYRQDEGDLRLDKAALKVIAAVATQNQLSLLTEALDVLQAMADGDRAIEVFNFHTSSSVGGNFQIGAVQRSDSGTLAMALGAFHFTTEERRRRVLFTGWGAKHLRFWTAAQKLTLNTTLYAPHREVIRQKLGVQVQNFLAGLDLG
jgi:hypothetical protein